MQMPIWQDLFLSGRYPTSVGYRSPQIADILLMIALHTVFRWHHLYVFHLLQVDEFNLNLSIYTACSVLTTYRFLCNVSIETLIHSRTAFNIIIIFLAQRIF